MKLLTLLLVFSSSSGFSSILNPGTTLTEVSGMKNDDHILQDVSLSAEEIGNGGENTDEIEEEQMMDKFAHGTNPTKKPVRNNITMKERMSDEELPLKKETKKKISKQMIHIPIPLTSHIVEYLNGTQEDLRFEEAVIRKTVASRMYLQKAKTGNYSLLETMDYLNRKESEKLQKNGIHSTSNSIPNVLGQSRSGMKILTDATNKWDKQEQVKCNQTDAKLKRNPVNEKERKLTPVIPLFVERRDAKENMVLRTTEEMAKDKEYLDVTLPLSTLSAHTDIHATQSQILLTSTYRQDFVHSVPNVSKIVSSYLKVKLTDLVTELQTVTPGSLMDIKTNHKAKKSEFVTVIQAVKSKPAEVILILKDLKTKDGNYTQKLNENTPTAKVFNFTPKPSTTQTPGKTTIVTHMENDTIFTVKYNKVSPPQPQGTKPSPRLRFLPTTALAMSPTKTSRSSKNKKWSKGKRRRKNNKTQKPQEEKKKMLPPTHFPYFMDDYCPPECTCYGRVVQCSDKGIEQIPYGIPYNSRYILLMNNQIDNIQLDLLSEYSSLDFLSLSNNRLTDGAIEGSFEGIPVLKRLYLDRNLLQSVPADLPVSLEELRLDNNHLKMMSEAVWAQCPSLLVLSLSNNSLGNGSESLPLGVLSPLHNLRTLNLDYNQLPSVPLELPLSIKELYLRGNHIEQLRRGVFNGISGLLVLDLSANKLKSRGLFRDSFFNVTHLESLNLEGNKLKQVPQNLPYTLKTLNLEGNLISSIKKASLRNLKNLEHLGLAKNKIFKVSVGAFKSLPVLHQLDLSYNILHQVPRQLPATLHSVALIHNKIVSVPGNAFCWGSQSLSLSKLVEVHLEHNLIDIGKLNVWAFRCLRGMQVVHFY